VTGSAITIPICDKNPIYVIYALNCLIGWTATSYAVPPAHSLTVPRAPERSPGPSGTNQFLSQGEIPSGPRGGEMPAPPGIAGFAPRWGPGFRDWPSEGKGRPQDKSQRGASGPPTRCKSATNSFRFARDVLTNRDPKRSLRN